MVDRLVIRPDIRQRLTDSVETASNLSGGIVVINVLGEEERDILFSQNYACEDCGVSIEELTPRMFSFNNPFGACPACTGLGSQMKIDPERILPNRSLSILEGAITASGWNHIKSDGISRMYFDALSKKYKFKLTDPVEKLSKEVVDVILYGTKGEKLKLTYDRANGQGTLMQPFEGICNNLERRYRETQSDAMRRELEECMSECPCPDCKGKGYQRSETKFTINIPAGVDNDSSIRKRGYGQAAGNGGEAGDLYIFFRIEPHKLLRREDKDLYVTVPISYKTAVLGGKIVVPSADDTIELNVPEGTASGTRFCVRGKGVKTVNGIGNLYVTVEIDIPQRLSREQAKKLSDYENAVSIKSCDNMQKYAGNISAVYGKKN